MRPGGGEMVAALGFEPRQIGVLALGATQILLHRVTLRPLGHAAETTKPRASLHRGSKKFKASNSIKIYRSRYMRLQGCGYGHLTESRRATASAGSAIDGCIITHSTGSINRLSMRNASSKELDK